MANLYSRLFKYRERLSSTPTENFLTEGLADLLERFPLDVQRDFILAMLPDVCHQVLSDHMAVNTRVRFVTQFPILVGTSTKFPDMVLMLDDRPFILFEVKINAAEQQHTFEINRDLDNGSNDKESFNQGQLQTYSAWIGKQSVGRWPGAVIFLTHQTPTPTGFQNGNVERKATIHVVKTWKYLGKWLMDHVDVGSKDTTYCALTADYTRFLGEKGLMTEYVTSRDLAAAELFIPSERAIKHTVKSVADAVISNYPTLKGGRVHVDIWAQGGVYWSWFFINQKLNLPRSRFFLAFGISFPDAGDFGSKDKAKLTRHEPFFFVLLADEWHNEKARDLLKRNLDSWIDINDEFEAVALRPLSKFDADPDIRAAAVMLWAQEEVGRLVEVINGFVDAPIAETVEEEAN